MAEILQQGPVITNLKVLVLCGDLKQRDCDQALQQLKKGKIKNRNFLARKLQNDEEMQPVPARAEFRAI